MAEWKVGIEAKRGAELIDGLLGAVRVLVGAAEEHMRQRLRGVDLDGKFQLIRGGGELVLAEESERVVEVEVIAHGSELDSALEFGQCFRGLTVLEICEAEQMMKFRVPVPLSGGVEADRDGGGEISRLQVTEQEAAGEDGILRIEAVGLFKVASSGGEILPSHCLLAVLGELLDLRRRLGG